MKTPIDFEYDLWTTEEGKCMVRIKATGEVTEVDRAVMAVLRGEEKRLRRNLVKEKNDEIGGATVLSLDADPEDENREAPWMVDPHDFADDIASEILEKQLIASLTDAQLDLYEKCIKGGMSLREYARAEGVNYKGAWKRKDQIQKKFKKIWG